MTRDELIAKLEQAEAGSRDFDIEIHKALGHKATNEKALAPDQIESWFRVFARHYSTSLDAALTLWDEPGKQWRHGINLLYDIMPGGKMAWRSIAWESDGQIIQQKAEGSHKSRPVSACIAALKATP